MVIFNDPFIGNLAQEFEKVFAQPVKATYPPYNVNKISDEHLVLEFALAGFNRAGIDISVEKDVLTIKGERQEDEGASYIHKGIAARKFTRSFIQECTRRTKAKINQN
jgi:HSP20 family molecular chaperone IbpA